MTDAIAILSLVVSFLGLSVLVIGGFVKFLYGRTAETDKQVMAVAGELRQSMNVQSSDHRLAQGNIWTELRRMSDRSNEQHSAMAETMVKQHIALVEAMGRLPTRDEMQHAIDALRKELMNK